MLLLRAAGEARAWRAAGRRVLHVGVLEAGQGHGALLLHPLPGAGMQVKCPEIRLWLRVVVVFPGAPGCRQRKGRRELLQSRQLWGMGAALAPQNGATQSQASTSGPCHSSIAEQEKTEDEVGAGRQAVPQMPTPAPKPHQHLALLLGGRVESKHRGRPNRHPPTGDNMGPIPPTPDVQLALLLGGRVESKHRVRSEMRLPL